MDRQFGLLDFPERLSSHQKLLPYALLLGLTFALYSPSLYFQFVWDDHFYVTSYYPIHDLSWTRLRAIWTSTYLGHYAPVNSTFLAVLYAVSGTDAFGYHLANLLLHAIGVSLLYSVLRKIESARVALLASLLFAVHPTNIETVAWISETKSTLAFLFFLLSFWAFVRYREEERLLDGILCGVFLVLSILSKINTVVAPAIFLLYDYRRGFSFKKSRAWSVACYFLLSFVFTGVHLVSFLGSAQAMESSYYGGLGVHLMNLPLLLAFYIRMTVFPHPLSAWEMFAVQEQFTWLVGLGGAGLLGMGWLAFRATRVVQFWVLWFVVFLAPVLQIIPSPIWVADRYLYIPVMGGFVLASRLFFGLCEGIAPPWKRWSAETAMLCVLLVFGWHTQNHLPVWKDDLSLWKATTLTCSTSAYCHMNLGLALLQQQQIEAGVKELIRSVEIRPNARNLMHLGDAYALKVRDYRQALIAYNMIREQQKEGLEADFYVSLARLYILMGNLPEADRAIQTGLHLKPRDPGALIINGFFHWKRGNRQEARQSLQQALAVAGRISNPAAFLYQFWGDEREVGELLSELRL